MVTTQEDIFTAHLSQQQINRLKTINARLPQPPLRPGGETTRNPSPQNRPKPNAAPPEGNAGARQRVNVKQSGWRGLSLLGASGPVERALHHDRERKGPGRRRLESV